MKRGGDGAKARCTIIKRQAELVGAAEVAETSEGRGGQRRSEAGRGVRGAAAEAAEVAEVAGVAKTPEAAEGVRKDTAHFMRQEVRLSS